MLNLPNKQKLPSNVNPGYEANHIIGGMHSHAGGLQHCFCAAMPMSYESARKQFHLDCRPHQSDAPALHGAERAADLNLEILPHHLNHLRRYNY